MKKKQYQIIINNKTQTISIIEKSVKVVKDKDKTTISKIMNLVIKVWVHHPGFQKLNGEISDSPVKLQNLIEEEIKNILKK